MRKFYVLVTFLSIIGSLIAQTDERVNQREHLKKMVWNAQSNQDLDSALYYCDQLSTLSGEDIPLEIDASLLKMRVLMHFNRSAEAYEIGVKCFEKFCKEDNVNCVSCSRISRLQSDLFWMLKDFRMSLDYLEQDCSRRWSWHVKKAGLLYELADTVGAFKILRDESLIPSGVDEKISWHLGVGIVFRKLEAIDEALRAYKKAFDLVQKHRPNSPMKPTIIGNIGEIYLAKGEFEKAERFLKEDAEGSLKNGKLSSYVLAEMYLGEIDFELHRDASVIDRFENVLKNYSAHSDFTTKMNMMNLILKSNLRLGRGVAYKEALERKSSMLEEKFELDAVDNRALTRYYTANAVSNVQSKMEMNQQILEKEIAMVNEREYHTNLRSVIIIISLVLILVIGFLLFRKYKTANEQKSLLKDAKLKLAGQEKEILSWRVAEEQRNVKELSIELGIKSDFSSSLNNQLKKLDSISIAERRSLEMFVQTELGIKSVRANLNDLIEDSESRFIATLRKKHPTLTDNDISLALMVVLQHSNKEISIKRSITEGSVKMAKHRLKQKFDLSSDERLFEYLDVMLKT